MEYSFKRGFRPEMERIKEALESEFSSSVQEEEGKLVMGYGAFKRVEIWIEGKKLLVDTESSPDSSDEDILDTNRRFRKFLEKATGYTAKQRVKQAKKDAQEG